MLWKHLRRSKNVIDNRGKPSLGSGPSKKVVVGGGFGFLMVAALGWLLSANPTLSTSISKYLQEDIKATTFDPTEHHQFIQAMLGVSEDVWERSFASANKEWEAPLLVLFTKQTGSACGPAGFDVGPFYCPADSTIYMDLDYFNLLSQQLKIKGDTAQAYIVFHEMGHHVQTLLGILPDTYAKMQRVGKGKESNALLVRMELQADCYAGIVFNMNRSLLEPGDVAEFVNAAARIGDDWIQSRSGKVMPDTFAHGTSEQRAAWLLQGYKTGSLKDCDTTANILPTN